MKRSGDCGVMAGRRRGGGSDGGRVLGRGRRRVRAGQGSGERHGRNPRAGAEKWKRPLPLQQMCRHPGAAEDRSGEAPGHPAAAGQGRAVEPGRGLGHRRRFPRQARQQPCGERRVQAELPVGEVLVQERGEQRVLRRAHRRDRRGAQAAAEIGQRHRPARRRLPSRQQQALAALGADVDEVQQRRFFRRAIGVVEREAGGAGLRHLRQAAQARAVEHRPAALGREAAQHVRLAGGGRAGEREAPVRPLLRPAQPGQGFAVGSRPPGGPPDRGTRRAAAAAAVGAGAARRRSQAGPHRPVRGGSR